MKENHPSQPTWYEQVFESTDLPNSTPELDPFVNVDKYPDWVAKMMVELTSQNMPAISIKELRIITPEKMGRFLGQKCANLYALRERLQSAQNPENIKQSEKLMSGWQKQKDDPVVASLLHTLNVAERQVRDLEKQIDQVGEYILQALKRALDQPSHQEAVEFFEGFGKGVSQKGLTPAGLAKQTTATPVYLKMFMHWQEIDQLSSVPALQNFLAERGLSKSVLGDISRLRRLCTRIGYAPGKRGRPAKSK